MVTQAEIIIIVEMIIMRFLDIFLFNVYPFMHFTKYFELNEYSFLKSNKGNDFQIRITFNTKNIP